MRLIFQMTNPQPNCTGKSTHWLRQSLDSGSPKLSWGQGDELEGIRLTHEVENATVDRMERLGFETTGAQQTSNATPEKVATEVANMKGYFYMTYKDAAFSHAMAGYLSATDLYFFEPERGLYHWNIGMTDGILNFVSEFPAILRSLNINHVQTLKLYPVSGRSSAMERQHQKLPS